MRPSFPKSASKVAAKPAKKTATKPVVKPVAKPAAQSSASLLHPRNRHQGRYNLSRLVGAHPPLKPYLMQTPAGLSVDFSKSDAVRELNRALLKAEYNIGYWSIPEGYLCPPVPGRVDYLHGLADLLAEDNGGQLLRGPKVRVLDIGTGANVIYPLLGQAEYGWQFVGSDIDREALTAAQANVQNNGLESHIELRRQYASGHVFNGLVKPEDRFALVMCNPPFHASAAEAAKGSQRKNANLAALKSKKPQIIRGKSGGLNFGGQSNELWCTGGEAAFLRKMIKESVAIKDQVLWFSSLVAKSEHLADVRKHLALAGALEVRQMNMAQGNKRSRFIAWSFQEPPARKLWVKTFD